MKKKSKFHCLKLEAGPAGDAVGAAASRREHRNLLKLNNETRALCLRSNTAEYCGASFIAGRPAGGVCTGQ